MGALNGSAAQHAGLIAYNSGTASSTPLAGTAARLNRFQKALIIFALGDMANETIDCVVETCDSNGSNNTTLKSATQLAGSASANDNKRIVIAVDVNDVIASGKEYIRGKITTGNTVGGTCQIVVVGLDPRYGPSGDWDDSSVVQIVP